MHDFEYKLKLMIQVSNDMSVCLFVSTPFTPIII